MLPVKYIREQMLEPKEKDYKYLVLSIEKSMRPIRF